METKKLLDTSVAIPAPEYIVFRYMTAGPVSRLFAVAIDLLVSIAVYFFILISFIALFFNNAAFSIFDPKTLSDLLLFAFMILYFVMSWFYFFLFEWLNRGRTPGKLLLSIRVVSIDGTGLDPVQVMIRNLLRIADMFPSQMFLIIQLPTYVIGALAVVSSGARFQRLGDLAAGTIVVRTERKNIKDNIGIVETERIHAIAAQLHMVRVPSATLTQAINDFVGSRTRLSADRLQEIALTVEKDLRKFFSAENVECTAEELLYAVHNLLFRLPGEELNRLQIL